MKDLDTSKTKSQSCSHSHTTAVINQDDRNYNNLEQTNPKAICEQELSAECFVKRITTKPFHPQPADNGQSAEQICKEAQRRADLKQSRHAGKEKSKAKVTKSSLCCGFFFFSSCQGQAVKKSRHSLHPRGTQHSRHARLLSGSLFAKGLEDLSRKVVQQSTAEPLIEYGCPPGC